MSEIGFIGLGNMGLPMAANLVAAGHAVTAFDTQADAMATAGQAGMAVVDSAAQAAAGRDFVVTMLPDGPIALKVFGEIVPAAAPGTVIVDCSTIDVASAKREHEMAHKAGLGCLDAPVSGGVGGAQAGTLTFMVGGEKGDFEKATPILDVMGGRLVHCGAGGAGQSAKICNNMLLGISMIGACEAFSLADKLGLDQQALFDVVSTSSGSCWSVNTYCPVPGVGPQSPADNDYQPGFAATLMLKDLGLSQQAADEAGLATPLGRHATDLYRAFVDADEKGSDFSGVTRYLAELKRDR